MKCTMPKKKNNNGSDKIKVKDTSERINPEELAEALGAEIVKKKDAKLSSDNATDLAKRAGETAERIRKLADTSSPKKKE